MCYLSLLLKTMIIYYFNSIYTLVLLYVLFEFVTEDNDYLLFLASILWYCYMCYLSLLLKIMIIYYFNSIYTLVLLYVLFEFVTEDNDYLLF